MTFATSSPGASTAAGQGTTPVSSSPSARRLGTDDGTQPICQNCTTSTTPLWRRDEAGSVLCNACGLFLKLHGRPRPISLKTDVIKSRNRVKNSGQPQKKKVRIQLAPPRAHVLTVYPPGRLASSTRRTRTVPPVRARIRPRDRRPALRHPATTTITTITTRSRRSRHARGHRCPGTTTSCCTTPAPTRRLRCPRWRL